MSDTNNGHGTELSQAVAQPMQGRPMMIKNLVPSLPERGKIKIGRKGEVRKKQGGGGEYQLPQKLDHFVVTTLQRGQDNNFIPDPAIVAAFGEKPKELPIRVLYDDVALNFPTRYAAYKGQQLWCSGDGEVANQMVGDGPARTQVKCPCFRQDHNYTGKDKCKVNGSLAAIIDGVGGVGGVWKFRTTSYNSVIGILSSMAFIKTVTGGPLANIPLTLAVRPKQVADPEGKQQTVYVVQLEYKGTIAELQHEGHRIALDRATTHLSIQHIEAEARRLLLPPPENAPLPGDDAEDIQQEFYPDSGEHIDEDGVIHEGEAIQNGTKPLGKLDKLDQILEGNATQVTDPAATQTKAPAETAQPKQDAKPAAEPKTPAPTGDPIFDEAAAIAAKGTAAFNAWWNGEGKALVPGVEKTKRLLINDRRDKLKEIATAADARPVTVPQDVADEPSDVDDEGEAETQTRTSGAGEDIEAGFEEMVKDLQACTALADVNLLSEKHRGFIVGLPDHLRSRWALALNAKSDELSKVKR